MSIICYVCNNEYPSNRSLSHHLKTHNMTIKSYYDKYLRKKDEGICIVCGKETSFRGLKVGYLACCSYKCANNNSINTIKQTKLERYGDANYNNATKAKQTNLQKYGCTNPQQNKLIKDKTKNTLINRYGGVGFQSTSINKKVQDTNLQKYGAANIWSSDYGKNKVKETNLKRYGSEYATQNKEIKQKIKNTCRQKYGVDCNLNIPEVKEKAQSPNAIRKRFESRKHKDYFRNSSWEMLFKQQLLEMGLVENKDFIQQYYSKEKYPFFCDFYLVNPDIYIEINGTWEHGGHPFMSSDTDREILDIWKSKIKDHPKYETAIFRWTIRDVDKRKTAEKNNLNFVELWSKEEINEYINYLKEEIYK